MIRFNLIILIYLIILLNIYCVGKPISVSLKIKDDWKEKREFVYLKNVELEERFVLEKIEKKNNFRHCSSDYNMEGFLFPVELNVEKNIFNVDINDRTYIPAVQLRKKVLIEIANNEIIQRILPECEKRVFYVIHCST